MDYIALRDLVKTHPTWDSETSVTLAAWVNAEVVDQDVERLPAETIYETIDPTNFAALSEGAKAEVWNILMLHAPSGVPTLSGSRARTRLVAIFGAGSDTIQALAALLSVKVSRAVAAGILQVVTPGDVEFALTQ